MDSLTFQLLTLFSKQHSLTLHQLSALVNNLNLDDLYEAVFLMLDKNYIAISGSKALNTDKTTLEMLTPLRITFIGQAELEKERKNQKHLI